MIEGWIDIELTLKVEAEEWRKTRFKRPKKNDERYWYTVNNFGF